MSSARWPTSLAEILAGSAEVSLRLIGAHATHGTVWAWSPSWVALDRGDGVRDLVANEGIVLAEVHRGRDPRAPTTGSLAVQLERWGLRRRWMLALADGTLIGVRWIEYVGDDAILIASTEGRTLAIALQYLVLARLAPLDRVGPSS